RALADEIVDGVRVRADPVGAHLALKPLGKLRGRRQAAPGDETGEFRRPGAEQNATDDRMNAVGADQRVARDRLAALKRKLDSRVRLAEVDTLRIEADRVRLLAPDRLDQHLLQVGAMHGVVRKSVALDRGRTERDLGPGLAGIPQAGLPLRGLVADAIELGT